MTEIRGYRVRIALFAVTALLWFGNALLLGGMPRSNWGDAILQTAACLSVIVCGVVVAVRVEGLARVWRLLVVAALTWWLVAQAVWWWHALVRHSPPPRPGSRLSATSRSCSSPWRRCSS